MTQMLLFDTPAAREDFSARAVVAAADCPATEVPPAEPLNQPAEPLNQPAEPLNQPAERLNQTVEHDADRGGMHRMGDLARLVLLRYELVAQRRAALAAKGAK